MKAPTKTHIRKAMTDLRGTLRYLEETLKADDWEMAYFASQDLVGTSVYLEEILNPIVNVR